MKPYRNILVGVNYTPASELALKQAALIAQKSGTRLRAFHAIRPIEINEFVNFYGIDRKVMTSGAQSSLEAFVERALGQNNNVSCLVSEGVPHHELCTLANETGADLLVIGAYPYPEDQRKAGQFAIKCLRFATMPVLLVREQSNHSFARLTACVDFSKSTNPILQHTSRMNWDYDQKVEIVHASSPPWLRPARLRYQTEVFENREQKEQYHEILEGQLSSIKNSAPDSFQTTPSTIALEHEDPAFALIDHLAKAHSGLAIIGRSGAGFKGLKTDLLGGTAEIVIRHAHCSVLIVPIVP
jgi:nucleotide-binding universal stress UspA family protein